jgi:phosphopantetheinyl transferase (holo-ACP synthase)
MFHGPSFRGIVAVGPIARDGLRGTIEAAAVPGALLDNAGQLFGFWVMLHVDEDRLAMPVRVQRIEFFGADPPPGSRIECTVHMTGLDAGFARADIELGSTSTLWSRISGWEDRRFESDQSLWKVLRQPEKHALATPRSAGYVFLRDRWRTAQARDFLMRRYLGERERAEYEALDPQRQRQWLAGRIAAKDAVRHWMWERGHGSLFPVEIGVKTDPGGRPTVDGPFEGDLQISIAHKDDIAVAMVRAGRGAGIDIEQVEARGAEFEGLAFTSAERALIPLQSRDAWITRFWAAKEAVAKARGTGLGGSAARFEITARTGETLVVEGISVSTCFDDEYIVACTEE